MEVDDAVDEMLAQCVVKGHREFIELDMVSEGEFAVTHALASKSVTLPKGDWSAVFSETGSAMLVGVGDDGSESFKDVDDIFQLQ
eukprot:8225473-Pyramimonas_sp.AAC.1